MELAEIGSSVVGYGGFCRATPKSNLDKALVLRGCPRSLHAGHARGAFPDSLSVRNMGKTVTNRITFIRTAILAVSVVVALLTSGRCNGSCGEYVYSRYRTPNHLVPDLRRHVALNDHDIRKSGLLRSSEENGVSHETFPGLPLPCSGPGCSQTPTPSLPVAPRTTIGSSHEDRLIPGQPGVELPSNVFHRREINGLARALRGFPLLIEMPPEFVG